MEFYLLQYNQKINSKFENYQTLEVLYDENWCNIFRIKLS